jgi:hypothetical protein
MKIKQLSLDKTIYNATFIRKEKWFKAINLVVLGVLFLIACKKNTDSPSPFTLATNSIFVVNQGNFSSSNGSISYIHKTDSTEIVDVYKTSNGVALGGQPQSFAIISATGYICDQVLGRVVVVDMNTFKNKGTISTGISSLNPRNLVSINGSTGYISDWGSGNVLVIDLNSNTLISQITSSGTGPDFLYNYGSKIYVAYDGAYSTDNKIGVINPSSNAVETLIQVGSGPGNIVSDINGKLWVLCSGAYNSTYSALQTAGSLVRIDPTTNTVELSLSFNDLSSAATPTSLIIDPAGNNLYYNYLGNVYQMNVNSVALPTTPFISKNFYGLSIDPINGQIIGCYAPNFTSAGKIIRYKPSGIAIDSFTVGIGPSVCAFR